MTNKEIHISFSPQKKIDAQEFLGIQKLKKEINFNENMVDVVVNLNVENKLDLEYIGEELTNIIIQIIQRDYLKEYVYKKYKDLYSNDLDVIYTYAVDVFDRMEKLIREIITKKVHDYLSDYNYINIDGFLTFRMKEIVVYLSSISEIALEEYLSQKDQNEFINVLKYFIDAQESKIDLLIINILKNGSFVMYDKEGNKIDNINEEIINMFIKEDLNYEDFLISTLLSLCPEKIQILDSRNDTYSKLIMETIKSIFEDKVTVIFNS